MLQNRFDLRAEDQSVPRGPVVQRLDADTIAGEEKFALAAVPDRESKHPAQFFHAAFALLLVEVNDSLGVAVSLKDMTLADQFLAQLAEVVDLSVEDDPDRPIFVGDRLVASYEIDDRQSTHAKRSTAVNMKPF